MCSTLRPNFFVFVTSDGISFTKIVRGRRMSWPKTDATHYPVQLRLSDKGHLIKELVVCRDWIKITSSCASHHCRLLVM